MKNVTVAIMGETFTDNLAVIPPTFERDGIRYTIHNGPRVQYMPTSSGMTLVKNFDVLLDFGLSTDLYFAQNDNICYHQFTRLPKTRQLIKGLQARESLTPADQALIEIPGFYLTVGDKGNHLLSDFGAPNSGKLVVKRENGARGASQAIVPATHLSLVLSDLNMRKLDRAEMVSKYPGVTFSDYPSQEDTPFLDSHDYLMVMDYLPDISAEYRLLLAGDKILGYQRDRSEGEFAQANLNFEARVSETPIELKELDELFTQPQASAVRNFISAMDLTFGSVDLYMRSGKLGLFEFCPQFGFYRMDPAVIQQLHMDFVASVAKPPVIANEE